MRPERRRQRLGGKEAGMGLIGGDDCTDRDEQAMVRWEGRTR